MGGGGANVIEELFGDDVADATGGAAVAGILAIIFQVVAVIEGDFFARLNPANGDEPDFFVGQLGFAVGGAAVIDPASRVPIDVAVDMGVRAESEDEVVALFATAERFGSADFFADVFEDASAWQDGGAGESADAVDGRRLEFDQGVLIGVHRDQKNRRNRRDGKNVLRARSWKDCCACKRSVFLVQGFQGTPDVVRYSGQNFFVRLRLAGLG